jgi:hypothetical protein
MSFVAPQRRGTLSRVGRQAKDTLKRMLTLKRSSPLNPKNKIEE